MTTATLIIADLALSVSCAALWLGTAAVMHARRARTATALLVGAMVVTLLRAGVVAWLGLAAGWWLVEEKVALTLPLLAVSATVASVLAAPPLVRALRSGTGEAPPGRAVLALRVAGIAALTGVGVTLVAGYPLQWSTVLVTAGVFGAGVLAAARQVPPTQDRELGASSGTARRTALRGGVGLVAGLVAGGAATALVPRSPVDTGGGGEADAPDRGTSVTDLRGPRSPAPDGTVRRHTLTARAATVELASGRRVEAWTFDGQVPGPQIEAEEGDLIEVTLRNEDITEGVTVHWHGYHVPAGEDGAPGATQEAVMPGGEFTYRFRAEQVGTFWYHTHQTSHTGVRRGLYGPLVVRPRDAQGDPGVDLVLALHTFDGVRVLGADDGVMERRAGAGEPVRLRVINTDSAPRLLTLVGAAMSVAAVDGHDLNNPSPVDRHAVRLPAGGRYDLTFAMPPAPVMLLVDHVRDAGLRLLPEETESGTEPEALASAVDWPELDLLDYGEPGGAHFDPDTAFDREFDLVLDRGLALVNGVPAYAQTVGGRAYPHIPTPVVSQGDLVLLTVVNRSLETHPWHLHGHTVEVVSRDGRPPTGSPLRHDTFDVRPGQIWQVAFQADNPGLWMNHCHDLAHAHDGMMLRLDYTGIFSPFDEDDQSGHGGHGGH